MFPTDAEIAAKKEHARMYLDNYQSYDHRRDMVSWALNFVGHEYDREYIAEVSLWLQL